MPSREKGREGPLVEFNRPLSPVRFWGDNRRIAAIVSGFSRTIAGFSLRSRLCGGANGIRTLGTVSAMLISTRVSMTYCD